MKHESRAKAFYDKRRYVTNWPENDMCDPPTPADIAIKVLTDELLGTGWYITMPENQQQVNTAVVSEILHKYIDDPKRYRFVNYIPIAIAFVIGFLLGMVFL